MEQLKGKNVLIVGATGGIGTATARLVAASGANVFISGRNSSKLSELREALNIKPEHSLTCDITDEASIQALADHIHSQVGVLDILIIASGTGIIKPLENLTADDFRQTVNTNLLGPFLLLKAFLPPMKDGKKGLIINIPGILGKVPMAGAAAYSASKYGLLGMMQSIREEIRRTEIRITNLFLGGVDSPFWDEIDLRVQRDKMIVADEAAKAIWFLCQQPSSGVVSEMVLQPFNHQAI